jgi:hypothetical protein
MIYSIKFHFYPKYQTQVGQIGRSNRMRIRQFRNKLKNIDDEDRRNCWPKRQPRNGGIRMEAVQIPEMDHRIWKTKRLIECIKRNLVKKSFLKLIQEIQFIRIENELSFIILNK